MTVAVTALKLSWSEQELPERERTKHVHRLHPYHGKFVPQLAETLLETFVPAGGSVLDPFAGSGTTLVAAAEKGYDSVGVELAAFNALLVRVKTARYEIDRVEDELSGLLVQLEPARIRTLPNGYLSDWYAPAALRELLAFRSLIEQTSAPELAQVILSRAARSARRAAHYDLEAPQRPQTRPYWCHKHRRICQPTSGALRFLRSYVHDTVQRLRQFESLRHDAATAVLEADACTVSYRQRFDALLTSPPYPGLIDYHGQHRYAYELLGLPVRLESEIGRAGSGLGKGALVAYADSIVAALANAASALKPEAPLLLVVNDRHDLYGSIVERAGFTLERRLTRTVERRTGRRAGAYHEDVLVCRPS